MAGALPLDHAAIGRWVRSVIVIFLMLGLGFGTWLSRLPAIRDALGATAAEMSFYGLCLAIGGLLGLALAGRIVHRYSAHRMLLISLLAAAVALPAGAALLLGGQVPLGLALLFGYGFAFGIADVAVSISGANAESVFGRPRMPLMYAGYSIGTVAATGVGTLAEVYRLPVPLHFALVMVVGTLAALPLLRAIPHDEQALRLAAEELSAAAHARADGVGRDASTRDASVHEASIHGASVHDHDTFDSLALEPDAGAIPVIDSALGRQPAFTTITGSIPIITEEQLEAAQRERETTRAADHRTPHPLAAEADAPPEPPEPPRSPWREPRILLLCGSALAIGLLEGVAANWLPMALVDGHGASNQLGSLLLSLFLASVLAVRLAGSWIIMRFGRVAVMRAATALSLIGLVATILVPTTAGLAAGVIVWGLGSGLCWPIVVSAGADRAATAARVVGVISALGYGSMMLGSMLFGLLGEYVGLLAAFWALLPFALYIGFTASAARPLPARSR